MDRIIYSRIAIHHSLHTLYNTNNINFLSRTAFSRGSDLRTRIRIHIDFQFSNKFRDARIRNSLYARKTLFSRYKLNKIFLNIQESQVRSTALRGEQFEVTNLKQLNYFMRRALITFFITFILFHVSRRVLYHLYDEIRLIARE